MIGIVRTRESDNGTGTEEYDWRCADCIDFTPVWGMDGEATEKHAEKLCTYCGNLIYIGEITEFKPAFEPEAKSEKAYGFHITLNTQEMSILLCAVRDDVKDWKRLFDAAQKAGKTESMELCEKHMARDVELLEKLDTVKWTLA